MGDDGTLSKFSKAVYDYQSENDQVFNGGILIGPNSS